MKAFGPLLLFAILALVQAERDGSTRRLRRPSQASSEEQTNGRSSHHPRSLQDSHDRPSDTSRDLREDQGHEDEAKPPDMARLFVKYTNNDGKKKAMTVANKVFQDYDDDSVIVVEVDQEGVEQLDNDESIVAMEEDHMWMEQGKRSGVSKGHRRLAQTTPYGIEMIQADQLDVGPSPVSVCIVDSGVAIDHPDINENNISGINRRSNIDDTLLHWDEDIRSHGTHVAGTMAARNNNLGVVGVGDIPLFVTRGLDDYGMGYESDVYAAVEQCEQAGAKIISLSLGGPSVGSDFTALMTRLYASGFLIFGAAGNYGLFEENFPAAHPDVIAVTAVEKDESYWTFSNYGPWLELAAPGEDIMSTAVAKDGNFVYDESSGTSMATPHAAAAAALLWSHFPTCTNVQIRYVLAYTAKDVGDPGCDDDYGYGIVQVKDAYDFLSSHSCDKANWGQSTNNNGKCQSIDQEPMPDATSVTQDTFPTPTSPTPQPTPAPSAHPTSIYDFWVGRDSSNDVPAAAPTKKPGGGNGMNNNMGMRHRRRT